MQINTDELRAKVEERYRSDMSAIDRLEMLSELPGVTTAADHGKGNRRAFVELAASIEAASKIGEKSGKRLKRAMARVKGNGVKTAAEDVVRKNNRILACLKPSEPFGPLDYSKAANIDVRHAGISLCYFAKKGWLKRVGVGQYSRTVNFPGADTKPAQNGAGRIQVPRLEPDWESLSDLLAKREAALKERDDANAHGRDKLAKILNDKVAMLTKKIEAKSDAQLTRAS